MSFTVARKDVARAVHGVMEAGGRSCVAFVGIKTKMPLGKVKCTRRFKTQNDFILTVGKLNYAEEKWCRRQLNDFKKVPSLRIFDYQKRK